MKSSLKLLKLKWTLLLWIYRLFSSDFLIATFQYKMTSRNKLTLWEGNSHLQMSKAKQWGCLPFHTKTRNSLFYRFVGRLALKVMFVHNCQLYNFYNMIEHLTTLKNNDNSRVWSVDWHPKQKLLASVGQDRRIQLWKQDKPKEWVKAVFYLLGYYQQSIITQHLKTVRCVKFSNKGDKIAVCSFDSLISIYILNESSYQFLTQLEGHENEVKCVDWHETDKKIASCSRDKNIWVWEFNPTTYQYECENILQGHTNDVKCIKWIDYSTLASCSYDDTIRIWTQNDDDFEQSQVLKGHESIVWSLDYMNGFLISCSSDLSVMLFKRDPQSLKFSMISRIQNIHDQPIYSVVLLYPYFITSSGDNTIKLLRYQQSQGNLCKEIQTVSHENDVNTLRLKKYQDHFTMASCSDDGTIKIWTVKV